MVVQSIVHVEFPAWMDFVTSSLDSFPSEEFLVTSIATGIAIAIEIERRADIGIGVDYSEELEKDSEVALEVDMEFGFAFDLELELVLELVLELDGGDNFVFEIGVAFGVANRLACFLVLGDE